MEEYYEILSQSSIFEQIPEEKYANILHCLKGYTKELQKDQVLINIGDETPLSGIVIEGTLEAAFFDENGNQISINFLTTGMAFGAERACCDWKVSPTRLRAVTDVTVLFLRFDTLLEVSDRLCPFRARVTANLLRDFARQTQFLNLRLRIMGQKYLRDKIKVYLQTLPMEEGKMVLPMNRRELAEFLYVDRSALSRELGRMQEEGIIEFSGKNIWLKDRDFLR